MSVITYDARGNAKPAAERYPFTAIVKFGDGWAPAAIAKTSIRPAHAGESWLEAVERVTAPPRLLDEPRTD